MRALLPLVEQPLGADAEPIRDALSQLQMAYVRAMGEPGGEPGCARAREPAQPAGARQTEGAGPAQRSGRLWVPGQ